jgi:hypothetical protein
VVDAGPPPPACEFSTGTVCTPTEKVLVAKSHDCYTCLVGAGCIDDDPVLSFGDTGNECGDLTGTTAQQQCLDALSCIVGGCARNATAGNSPSNCYCGTNTGAACLTPGNANGMCVMQETTGLGTTDPTAVLGNFTNKARPAGIANQIITCAIANTCTSCF